MKLRVARDEAGVARVQQPVPEPAEQYQHAITESDQKSDVNPAPEQPCEEAAELESADLRNCPRFTDDGQ